MVKTCTTRVCFICPGLGHVRRGFESFTQECFDALRGEPSLDVTLFKGGGPPQPQAKTLWNLPRATWGAKLAGRVLGSGYVAEQASFGISLLPHLAKSKPDVVYVSDFCLGHYLWHWRQRTNSGYRILFSNGGPTVPPYAHWDLVQQVAPRHMEDAITQGEPVEKQILVPYGVGMASALAVLSPAEKAALKQELGLPAARSVVLSVGLVNTGHKRMDYLVRELAALPAPRPFLVMLGQQDEETSAVRALANALLGPEGFLIATVPREEVEQFYSAADAFVLASFIEGLPRVLIEALAQGLPCLVHDYDLTRFALGEAGYYADFSQTGTLAGLLTQVLAEHENLNLRQKRYQSAYERFSWERLAPQYVNMIHQAALMPMAR